MRFNGSHYDGCADAPRLSRQHERIKSLMLDGVWRTLAEIEGLTGDPPASISAQLRHLRKPRFGAFIVEVQARGDRAGGLFEYRVLPPDGRVPAVEVACPRFTKADWREARGELSRFLDAARATGCIPLALMLRLITYVECRSVDKS